MIYMCFSFVLCSVDFEYAKLLNSTIKLLGFAQLSPDGSKVPPPLQLTILAYPFASPPLPTYSYEDEGWTHPLPSPNPISPLCLSACLLAVGGCVPVHRAQVPPHRHHQPLHQHRQHHLPQPRLLLLHRPRYAPPPARQATLHMHHMNTHKSTHVAHSKLSYLCGLLVCVCRCGSVPHGQLGGE